MKTLLIIILSLFSGTLLAPGHDCITLEQIEAINPYSSLIRAIVKVESNNNNLAFNKTEQAYGPFQIRPIRLKDYNQRTGSNYVMEDCYNYELSERIFMYYCSKYHYEDIKAICIAWNGKSSRNKYYSKVINQLKNL